MLDQLTDSLIEISDGTNISRDAKYLWSNISTSRQRTRFLRNSAYDIYQCSNKIFWAPETRMSGILLF